MVPALLSALALYFAPTAYGQAIPGWNDYGTGDPVTPTPLLTRNAAALTITGNAPGSGTLTNAATLASVAIAYSPTDEKFVMMFSSRVNGGNTGAYSDCASVFALGRAESADGLNWNVDSSWAIFPGASSTAIDHCEAVQPTLAYDETTDLWHAWYVAKVKDNTYWGDTFKCLGSSVRASGIAHATSTDGVSWTTDGLAIDAPQMISYEGPCASNAAYTYNDVGDFGSPSVTRVNGIWYMTIFKAFNTTALNGWPTSLNSAAVFATSTDGETWSVDPDRKLAMVNGDYSWMTAKIEAPKLLCEDAPGRSALSTFVGGANSTASTADTSIGLVRWDVESQWNGPEVSPLVTLTSTQKWRQWTPVRVGDDYLLYYTNQAQTSMFLAYTTPDTSWTPLTVSANECTRVDTDLDLRVDGLDDCDDTDNSKYAYVFTHDVDADAENCNDGTTPWLCGAPEGCDGIDRDCSGVAEDNLYRSQIPGWYLDADNDGFGDIAFTAAFDPNDAVTCDGPAGYVGNNQDCDDANDAVNPLETEQCNLIDDDCDDVIDENDAIDATTWYADADADAFGDATLSTDACDAPAGYVADDQDCDDDLATVFPGAEEVCNAIDDDCDSVVDEPGATGESAWYADSDNDGYGDLLTSLLDCDAPDGYTANDEDCDDTLAAVFPGAEELCNGIDDNCDNVIDEGDATDATTWYADADNDSFGNAAATLDACSQPDGYIADNTDCNDTLATVFPGAVETCNDLDDDCDTLTDEPGATGETTWYADADNDTFGDALVTTLACNLPAGYAANDDDCNDALAAVNPDGLETCNDLDDDCDGTTDGPDAADATTWYTDADGDGFGVDATAVVACDAPESTVSVGGDCDDAAAGINPDAIEIADNDIDENCDGVDGASDDTDGDTDDTDGDTDSDTDDTDGDTDGDDCANTATGGVGIAGGGGGCCARRDVDESQCAWIVLPLMPLVYLRRRRKT